MRTYKATLPILILVSTLTLAGCGASEKAEEIVVPKDNIAACKSWQKNSLEFLKADLSTAGSFWAHALNVKITAELAEPSLAKSMNIVAEKYETVTRDEIKTGSWNTTDAQNKAINDVLDTCENLGIKVRLNVNN